MSEDKTQEEVQETYSEEEISQMRESMQAFYESEIPYLKTVKEYHDLKAEIEEAKYREFRSQVAYASLHDQVSNPPEEPKRKIKR